VFWGVLAELCLLSVLAVWLSSTHAIDRAVFGRVGALALLVVSLCVVPVGVVASMVVRYGARDWSRGCRWTIAGPLGFLAVAVMVSGLGTVAGAGSSIDSMLGWMLLVGEAAMVGVAIQVIRVRATGSRDRLRRRFEQLRTERNQSR
jgi:hypothetical protein